MVSTGIIRCVDNLGRLVLPKELRKILGITPATPLEILTEGDTIMLRRYESSGACVLCGEVSPEAVLFHGKPVCPACRKAIAGV